VAIKSKGRTRGRRAVSAAPRRALVVRKPPIWRRPWIWILVGVLALGGIGIAVRSALHSSDVKAKTKREASAVNRFFIQLGAALPDDRQAVPPDVLVIFPSVGADLPKIGKDIKGEAVKTRGKEIIDAATESVTKLQAIQVNKLIPAEFPEDRATMTDSLFLISRAIGLYQEVGGIVQAAADLPAKDQKALIDQAGALTQQAGSLFDEGYRKLLRIGNRLKVAPRIANPAPPVAPVPPPPSASATPSAAPSATPTETATTTPTPTASASG
jgi:hypothetical protein